MASPRTRICVLSCLLTAWTVSCIAAEVQKDRTPFDAAGFSRLPVKQQCDRVITALEAREVRLSNLAFVATESRHDVSKKDGQIVADLGKDEYEVRILNDRSWAKNTEYFKCDPNAAIRTIQTMAWDGRESLKLFAPPYMGTKNFTARVDPKENSALSNHRLTEILGLRMRTFAKTLPVAKWLRGALTEGKPFRVQSGITGDYPWILLSVQDGGYVREFVVDPSRGFLLMRVSSVYGKNANVGATRCVEVTKVGGLWLPLRVTENATVYYTKTENLIDTRVSEYRIGALKAQDVTLELPIGSDVVDTVRHISYTIEAKNKYRLKRLVLKDGVTLMLPPANPVVPRIDEDTSKLYRPLRRPDY